MKVGEAQSRLGNAVDCGRRDDPAKRARNTVALVVGHDEQDVGRTLGRHYLRRPPRSGLFGVFLDDTAEFRRRWRELFPVEGGRGAGRTRNTIYLLVCHVGLLSVLTLANFVPKVFMS